jgi:hypothetical protein
MTQLQTQQPISILTGSRGIGARSQGGAYSADAQQDNIDTDSFSGPFITLGGTTDAINPHVPGNYVVTTAQVNAMTITAPTAGVDDGLCINVWSDTLYAHTITCATAVIAGGDQVVKTVITFKAFRGAGVTLRAWQGTWQVVGRSGITSIA